MRIARTLVPTLFLLLFALGCVPVDCVVDEDCPVGWICGTPALCEVSEGCEDGIHYSTCVPEEEKLLCKDTGGLWSSYSCGHYSCGEFPDCDALIPGCNCGRFANYVEGEGCVDDVACHEYCDDEGNCGPTGWCDGEHPCPFGFYCYRASSGDSISEYGECWHLPKGAVCLDSGGEWVEDPCVEEGCGWGPDFDPGLCDARSICNCGEGRSYVDREGCLPDPDCAVP